MIEIELRKIVKTIPNDEFNKGTKELYDLIYDAACSLNKAVRFRARMKINNIIACGNLPYPEDEIEKTFWSLIYDNLYKTANYDSSDDASKQFKEDIKKRIVSGELNYPFIDIDKEIDEKEAFEVDGGDDVLKEKIIEILHKHNSESFEKNSENKGNSR